MYLLIAHDATRSGLVLLADDRLGGLVQQALEQTEHGDDSAHDATRSSLVLLADDRLGGLVQQALEQTEHGDDSAHNATEVGYEIDYTLSPLLHMQHHLLTHYSHTQAQGYKQRP